MNNIIVLNGREDIDTITDNVEKDKDTIFILDDEETRLCQYIDYMHSEKGLPNKILYKLKICKQVNLDSNITLADEKGIEICRPRNMKELFQKLEMDGKYHLIVESDDRKLLAEVMQQLVYVDYPIVNIDVKLRKEYKDAAKTAVFMKTIDQLDASARSALIDIAKVSEEEFESADGTKVCPKSIAQVAYDKIVEQIGKAREVEMKVAVAASKKTGKSVIANCMFGMELAPTSLEMATPNSCIYRRSPDNKFHLKFDGAKHDFSTADAIFKHIQKEFKEAERNAEEKFAIADMEIEYVSNGNNFESYTIYDTPGPDAAGTDHGISAKKAIRECDVALFAIDYSKYLIPSEEDYLKEIKTIFEEKGKFHSLVFVLNKMDMALQDKGVKSRIKSIDFIRNRLIGIDEKYADCVIFGTSAQDYFYTIELRDKAKTYSQLQPLLEPETDWYRELRGIGDELEDEDDSERLGYILSNLDSEAGKIKKQLGYKAVTMNDVEQYSGMPQLMSYVSYIAKSKAREEIVNSITYTIDEQCSTLNNIINRVRNIEILMNKSQDEINVITDILDQYAETISSILTTNISKKDSDAITYQGGYLKALLDSELKKSNLSIPLKTIIDKGKNEIIVKFDKSTVLDKLRTDFIEMQVKALISHRKTGNNKTSIDQLMLNGSDLSNIIEEYYNGVYTSNRKRQQKNIDDISIELNQILQNRLALVKHATEECKDQLKKNDCDLILPEFPTFDPVIKQSDMNIMSSDIHNQLPFTMNRKEIESAFTTTFMTDLTDIIAVITFIPTLGLSSIFISDDDDKIVQGNLSWDELRDKVANAVYRPFDDWFKGSNIVDNMNIGLESLFHDVNDIQDDIINKFEIMTSNCRNTVALFKATIDDRSHYIKKIEDLQRQMAVITEIQKSSEAFLTNWRTVLNG